MAEYTLHVPDEFDSDIRKRTRPETALWYELMLKGALKSIGRTDEGMQGISIKESIKKCAAKERTPKRIEKDRSDFRAGDFSLRGYLSFREGNPHPDMVSLSPEDLGEGMAEDLGYDDNLDSNKLPAIQEISYSLPCSLLFLKGALHELSPLTRVERKKFQDSLERAVKKAYEARAIRLCELDEDCQ